VEVEGTNAAEPNGASKFKGKGGGCEHPGKKKPSHKDLDKRLTTQREEGDAGDGRVKCVGCWWEKKFRGGGSIDE